MATADITGKKFVKTTAVEVIDASGNQVLLQDVNKTHKTYTVPRDEFEADYAFGEDILEHFATLAQSDDMAVSNNENDTKEVETEETK